MFASRRDFIEGRLRAGKPVAPSLDLARYSLQRLRAIIQTLRCLRDGKPIDSTPDAIPEPARADSGQVIVDNWDD